MSDEKPLITKFAETVITVPLEGLDLEKVETWEKIEAPIRERVKQIIDKLKDSHEKFKDPDFGPNDDDPYGAVSFYGSQAPDPSGAKYPAPESMKWVRPRYADDNKLLNDGKSEVEEEEEEDEFASGGSQQEDLSSFCDEGKLFSDGTSSGDVLQGKLGDCWFLGALAVMGANPDLICSCFWPFRALPVTRLPDGSPGPPPDMSTRKCDSFKEHGLFVLRFFKDSQVIYVIVDDLLPVHRKENYLMFAHCKDKNELWVPIIEKGYAKLFGSYKALIGGYAHNGLSDLTGFPPRLVVTKEGIPGFVKSFSAEDVWSMLTQYRDWKSLMGCSIQSDPKAGHKVEHTAGQGLMFGHAYSLLDCDEIDPLPDHPLPTDYTEKNGKMRMVKVRNPWGHTEWSGPFGDITEERKVYDEVIKRKFDRSIGDSEKVNQDENDGTFMMPFKEFFDRYNNIFVAIRFPDGWAGKRIRGEWSGKVGGNRAQGDWFSNPKIKIRLKGPANKTGKETNANNGADLRDIFIGIYIRDARMILGFDFIKDPLYACAVGFDVVTPKQLEQVKFENRKFILGLGDRDPDPNKPPEGAAAIKEPQPAYNFGTTQAQTKLLVDEDYYIIPSLCKRNLPGVYFMVVYGDCAEIDLQGDVRLMSDSEPKKVGSAAPTAATGRAPAADVSGAGDKALPLPPPPPAVADAAKSLTKAQFYQLKETLRERFVQEATRLKLTKDKILQIFRPSADDLDLSTFKSRILELGFNMADFPESDLRVMDEDGSGSISKKEFDTFLDEGFKFAEGESVEGMTMPTPLPTTPVDDLLFKLPELKGTITVNVIGGRNLRKPAAWFTKPIGETLTAQPSSGDSTDGTNVSSVTRKIIKYDPKVAEAAWQALLRAKEEAKAKALQPSASQLLPDSDLDNVTELQGLGSVSTPSSPVKGGNRQMMLTAASLNAYIGKPPSSNNNANFDTQSMASRARVEKLGKEAGVRLHFDADMQDAEANRTAKLLLLKKKKQSVSVQSVAMGVERESVLRKRSVAKVLIPGNDRLEDLISIIEGNNGVFGPFVRLQEFDEALAGVMTSKYSAVQFGESAERSSAVKASFFRLVLAAGGLSANDGTTSNAVSRVNLLAVLKGLLFKAGDARNDRSMLAFLNGRNGTHAIQASFDRKLRRALAALTDPNHNSNGNIGKSNLTWDNSDDENSNITANKDLAANKSTLPFEATSTVTGPQSYISGNDRPTALEAAIDPKAKPAAARIVNLRSITAPPEKDLWDILIDSVFTIVKARSSTATSGSGRSNRMLRAISELSKCVALRKHRDVFAVFDAAATPIRTPSRVGAAASISKDNNHNNNSNANAVVDPTIGAVTKAISNRGNMPTSKSAYADPGRASVVTKQSLAQQRNTVDLARGKLKAIAEDQENEFDEVYRRLVAVPTITSHELEGDRFARSHAFEEKAANSKQQHTFNGASSSLGKLSKFDDAALKKANPALYRLFIRFDKNANGFISRDEFKEAMKDLNVSMSADDTNTLFNRFQTEHDDDEIEWKEFVTFFDAHVKSNSDLLAEYSKKGSEKRPPIELILDHMRSVLGPLLQASAADVHNNDGNHSPRVASDENQENTNTDTNANASNNRGQQTHKSNHLLNELSTKANGANVEALRVLGVDITVSEMSRINRIFNNSVGAFNDFMRNTATIVQPLTTSNPTESSSNSSPSQKVAPQKVDFATARKYVIGSILQRIESRSGATAETGITAAHTAKIWVSIKGNANSSASFKEMADYFVSLVEETLHTKADASTGTNIAANMVDSFKEVPAGVPVIGDSSSAIPAANAVADSSKPKGTAVEHHWMELAQAISPNEQQEAYDLTAPLSVSAADKGKRKEKCCRVGGYSVSVLCNIVVDAIAHSQWNKATGNCYGHNHGVNKATGVGLLAPSVPPSSVATKPSVPISSSGTSDVATVTTKSVVGSNSSAANTGSAASTAAPSTGGAMVDEVSYSGFEAFARESHVASLETKLRYLVHLETNRGRGSVLMLVHVYVNLKQDHVVVLAYDPMSGDVFKYEFKESVKDLPIDERLHTMISELRGKDSPVLHEGITYNPWETPVEDMAISEMVSRLRLMVGSSSPSSSKLILAEDSKYVAQLKTLLDKCSAVGSASVPFFSIASDLVLYFEVEKDALQASSPDAASIEKIVFGTVRRMKPLYNFLVGSLSSLNIALSTYNGGRRISMDWTEMLAYLCDYRNPFVTVQLLPRFVEPEEYFYNPNVAAVGFTGEDAKDPNPVMKGEVDVDGGSYPRWNAKFKAQYKDSGMTACKVIAREVAKLKIDGLMKYAMVFVREGKFNDPLPDAPKPSRSHNTFFFLTIYDPRTSTDYQCGLAADCALRKKLVGDAPAVADPKYVTDVTDMLGDAVKNNLLIVGPAITPQLALKLYNKRGREEELLGSCKISVSSVLSTSGSLQPVWNKLTYSVVSNNDKSSEQPAGEVMVDLSFRKDNEESKSSGKKAPSRPGSRKPSVANIPSAGDQSQSSQQPAVANSSTLQKQLELLTTEKAKIESENKVLQEKLAKEVAEHTEYHKRLKEQHDLAVKEFEKQKQLLLEQKKEKEDSQQATGETVNTNATINANANSGNPIPVIANVDDFIKDIIKTLKSRHERKVKAGIVVATAGAHDFLAPLEKLLESNAAAAGECVTGLSLCAVLADLNYDLATKELSDGLVTRAKETFKLATVAVHWRAVAALIKGEKFELKPISQPQPPPAHVAPVAPDSEAVKNSERKPSTASAVKTTRDLSATAPLANVRSSASLNSPMADQSKLAATIGSPQASAAGEGGGPITEEEAANIKWDIYPLPPKWERRVHEETKRTFYVDHSRKKTQWYHPLDPTKKFSKTKKA